MYRNPQESITIKEATIKMERYCAYQERCHKDVMDKLRTMRLIPEGRDQIILHLLQHNFLNEERFAKSFARGKFRIKNWGKQRIIRELKYRNISAYNIKTALKEIPQDDYLNSFHKLAEKKYSSLALPDTNKNKKKLMDYLLYRGWEHQLVYDKIRELF